MTTTAASSTPTITATANADGTGIVRLNGTDCTVAEHSVEEARSALIGIVVDHARTTGAPVRVIARGPDGESTVIVSPAGEVQLEQHAPSGGIPPVWPPNRAAASSAPAGSVSFLTEPPSTPEPARTGWRGALSKLGLRVAPSAAELRYRDDLAAVSRHCEGPRTIVVANGKGGSCKTPTTIGLSAVFARYGGGGVAAWSNHQMRGTLGWHTVQSPHAATTQDLLRAAPELLQTAGQASALARYVHHQPADRFDVLQADPTKTSDEQRFNHDAVDTIHAVLSRFYRLIVMDSDNDESTAHWLRMIDKADVLVVATSTDEVRAEAGRLMLDGLRRRGSHAAKLADNAVVIVSQAHQDEPPAAITGQKFSSLGLQTAVIPYDLGMKRTKITFDGLTADTQRAYIAAGAMVARQL